MMDMKIIRSKKTDSEKLTEIAKKAKAFWGYSEELIKLWENDLTITENYIKKSKTYHIEKDETIIGFYSFFEQEPKVVCLDNVFIKPDYIGKGFGRILMEDFFKKIKKTEYDRVVLNSDPNAVSFYEKFGFGTLMLEPAKIEGRFLPVMIKNLKPEISTFKP